MKRLILDLRDNPGGPLDQAIRDLEPVPAQGRAHRLHQGPHAELERGVSRHRGQRLHAPAARRARQPQLGERVRDRQRRAAGSRSRPHRRRDDVRQGARAVGLQRRPAREQQPRRPRAHDRPLLHAERADDSAAVGWRVRRVPDLLAARPDGGPVARFGGAALYRRQAQGVRRRRHRAGQVPRSGRSKASTPRASGASLWARADVRGVSPTSSSPKATRASSAANKNQKRIARGFTVTDAMLGEYKALAQAAEDHDRRGELRQGRRVHPGDDSLRHRPGALRRRGGAPQPRSPRIRRRSSPCSSFRTPSS